MTWLIVQGFGAGGSATLEGTVAVPGDKSISHRALMLAALADGTSVVEGFLPSGDCLATLDCVRQLGAQVDRPSVGAVATPGYGPRLQIKGRGLHGLVAPDRPLNCRRSGTTMRLLSGILAGQAFDSELTGESQLLRRPMRRITEPLRQMGADITDTEGHAPLLIRGGGRLRGSDHVLPVASAQVKSAVLLAGLYADGPVNVLLPGPARDHTERMLMAQIALRQTGERSSPSAGRLAAVSSEGGASTLAIAFDAVTARLDPGAIDYLRALTWVVPGDFSSAAFLLAAALCIPSAKVTLLGVGVNRTRTGLLEVLLSMGADVTVDNVREQGGEPVADVTASASGLMAAEVSGDTVVRMIDEFPILAVLATQAEGTTVVRDAAELRVKETDRIASVVMELRKLGAEIEPRPDGFVVVGPTRLQGAEVDSQGDHRLGMALVVAGLIARGETKVMGAECIPDSFPGFAETMTMLGAELRHGE